MNNKNTFYKSAINFITGKIDKFSVTGTEKQVMVTEECLLASRALYEALESNDSKLSDILVLAENKNSAGRKYASVFRTKWRL